MAGSSSTILVRILGNSGGLQKALASAYVSLGGLERMSGTITSGFRVAAIAVGAFSASAVAAGAVGAAALAGIPAILLAIGIVAGAQSKKVRDAYSDMADHVVSVMKDIAAPLVDPLVRGAGTIQKAFDLIAPSLERVFAKAAPLLDRMFAQLIPLARQLGPLFEEAFAVGTPVLMAFVRGLTPLVAGIRAMFQELGASRGAFREFVDQLMQGLGLVLPALGRLLAAFAPIGAEILGSLLPAFADFLDLLANEVGPVFAMVTGFMSEHADVVRVLVAVLGGLVILAQIAQLFIALGGAIGVVLSPAGLLIAAVAGIAIGLVYLWNNSEQARNTMTAIAEFFTGTLVPAAKAVGSYIAGTLAPAIADTARKVGSNLQPIVEKLAEVFREDIVPAVKSAADKFREAWPEIEKLASRIGSAYRAGLEFWSAVAGKVLPVVIDLAGKILGVVIPAIAQFIVNAVKVANALIDAGQAAAKFLQAVKAKVEEALAFIRSIPGKVKSALGDLGGLLVAAGSALIGGFISGITSRIGDVQGVLGGITDKLTSWKGPPEKDKRLLIPAGQKVIEGFIRGIRGSISDVRDALGEITQLVQDVMDKRYKSDKLAAEQTRRVIAALKDERLELLANAAAHDKIIERLDAARTKWRDLIQQSKAYAKSIKASIVDFGNITQFVGDDGRTTFEAIVGGLQERLTQARAFKYRLEELAKAGLDKRALDQLAQAGWEAGGATAQALLDGLRNGQSISEVNQLMRDLAATGGALGNSLGETMYGAAIDAAAALVDKLKERAGEIAAIGVTLANAFLEQLRKAGIKIKTPKGLTDGVTNPVSRISQTAFASAPAAAPVTVNINVTAPVGASSADIGRELEKHLGAFFAAGGRRLAIG